MVAEFENYRTKKGLWWWVELTIASFISERPELSASKSDELIKDFLDSAFYYYLLEKPNMKDTFYVKD